MTKLNLISSSVNTVYVKCAGIGQDMQSNVRFKVIVLGDYGVGKTSILKSVATLFLKMDRQYCQKEIEMHVLSSIKREPVTMVIWDTGSK